MAAKNLGDLIFDLALDDSKFQAAITRSIDAIKKLNNAAKGISALSVGDAGGVTGGGAARMAKEQSRGAFMRQLASFAAMTKREQADKAKAEQQAANEERKLFAGRLSAYGKMVAAEVRMKQKAEKEKADAAIREGKREQREAEIRVRQKFKLERDVMQALMKAQAQYDREQAKLASAAMRERAKAEAAEAKRAAQRKAAADAAPGTILSTLADSGRAIASSIETAFNRITVAVAAVGTAITVLGARFEKTIGTVAVLSGGSLPELTAAARQFGTTSVFSAQEAADAMLNFAQAGMTAEENIAATGSAIKLASASGSDLSLTTSIMSDAMSQFSLTTGEAANLADIFTFALNDSKLGMNDLSVSMRYAGTVGAGFGMSVQETTAALMMFSNLGLKGSKAGTVFRLAMNSAANTTAVADKILKAYNLTQQDINPAIKKFGDILKVVSDRQITVNDAMKIFGMEAGANIVALAEMQKNNEGTAKSFDGLVAGMQKATEQGLAATTAAEMMNNVADQFRLLIAKISEAGFSIYYAFSEPLKALIVEVSGVASDVLDAFGFASASIEDSVGGALTNLTAYVKDNRAEIVASVLSFIDGFGKLSAQILSLAPVFAGLVSFAMDFANAIMNVGDAVAALIPGVDSAAQVFAALFVAGNVLAFAAAIQKVVGALRAMQAAMVAAEVSAGVLTGGIGLLVAGSLALVAVLADYASANDSATDSVNNLFAAEEHRRQVNDKAYAAELARIDELLNATRARATEVLKGGKEVTDEQKREAESLLRLTKEQAAAEIRAGRLVKVKGELATASQVAAMKAQGEATAVRMMYKQQEAQEKAAITRLETLRKAKIDADKAARAAGGASAGGISRAAVVTTMAQTVDQGEIQSYEELELAIKDAEKALEQIKEQNAAFGRELTIAESKTKKTTAALSPYNKSLGESAKQEAKAAREAAALADEFERLSAAAMEYYERSKAALVETPFPKAKELEDQIATMRDAFQKAIDYGEENGQDTIALQARVIFTERNMRLAAAKEAARDAELAARESVGRLVESQQTEQEKRDAARAKELEDARVYFNQLLVLADADADEYGRVVQAKREKQKAINDFYNAADLAAEEEYQAKLAEIRRSTAEKFTAEVEAIEAKGMTAAARIRQDASDKVKRIIDDEVKAYRDANKEREVSDIEAMMFALEALARNKEAAAAIFADAEKEAKKVETPFEKLKRTVVGIFGEDAGKALDNLKKKFEEMGGVGKRIAQIIAKVFKGAFGVIKGGFDVVMGVVTQISGFSLNILGTIQDAIGFVQSEQKAAIEDASERAKAAGFDPAMAERRAAAATRPDDLATKFVDNLVGGAVRITQLFVAVVGPVISELAAQLPSLFTAVANAIPQIVTAFAQNIGPLVAAIVDGVPKVAIALIEAIPTIAKALIEAILYDLLPAIPEIAWSLVTSIWTALWETLKAAGGAIGGWIGSLFGGGDEGGPAAYSGMDYVPSTMRATLHQGEAVIPADRNARRLRGATAPAPAGADQNYGGRGGVGGFGPLEVAVIAEGRLLEAVQMRAEDMGRATGMGKRIRKAAGVKVGFSRGDYNPWSR